MDKKFDSVINQSLDLIMSDRFGRYSKYIIQGRALPDVRDGLKPVQRRILYAMNELGLTHNSAYKKSARVVGEVIGKYHPHGDSSIYEAMVRMAQDWKMNMPLIDMHGNKGSIDDDPAAAMRYTETRLAKISSGLLDNIKKDTVKFIPNFDDSEKEPVVLPALMPNLLVNGAKGIASGYATEMPPHNLGEIIDAIIFRIKSPNCKLDSLTSIVLGPDFPTGGIVQGAEGIHNAFKTGSGRVVNRSKFTLNTSKTAPHINITEIPYGVIKQKLVRDIDEIRFNKKISGIKEVRDETDRTGLSIMIELTPGTDAAMVANYLLQKTEMQVYYSYNNIVIRDNAPKLLGLIDLIDAYLDHQRDVQTKAIKFDLDKDSKRHEIVEGLIKVATITDDVIEVIKKAEGSKSGVIASLKSKFKFTELQANAIAELRLYRLSRTDQSIFLAERDELAKNIAKYKELLKNPESFDKYLIDLLKEFKNNFGVPRKTEVQSEMEKIEVNVEDLIKHEEAWIGISRLGYIKRFSNKAFEANEITGYGLKDQDALVYLHKINTADKLLVFTNKGKYLFIAAHTVLEAKWKDIGKHVNDFATIDVDEQIIDAVSVHDFKLPLYLALVSSKGQVKRTPIADFELARTSKTAICFKLDADEKLVAVRPTNGYKEVILFASNGKAVKFDEKNIPTYGPKSSGVKGMILSNAEVSSMVVADDSDVVGLISKRGGCKRIKVSAITPASRATQGKAFCREIKGNPHVAIDARIVRPETFITFRDASEFLITKEFKNVDITDTTEGFSLIGPAQTIDGRIITFNRLHEESTLLMKLPEKKSEAEIFKDAEDKVDKAMQLSLEDILKDIE